MFRKSLEHFREMQRVTGPAVTLLLVSTVLVVFATIARAEPHEQVFEPTVDVSARAPAEVVTWVHWSDGQGRVSVTVDAAEDDTYSVYLPGLALTRVTLRYDAETAQHTGTLVLPAHTPRVGHFTLRLLDQSARIWDFGVRAAAPAVDS